MSFFSICPPGVVLPFAGSNIPEGWLLCNGAEVSRATYPALFSAIGTAHGRGNNTTTFNLPDMRGRFVRGVDSGVGRDPDRGSRIAATTGGNAGDAVGSVQGMATSIATGNQGGTKATNGVAVGIANTSKTDSLALEPMSRQEKYLGKRVKRGLFQSSLRKLLNADINGAINILRKSIGDAFVKELTCRGCVFQPWYFAGFKT